MRALSASQLLGVWERERTAPLFQRALTLLAAASPETPSDVLARLSIGQRDARLLTLRGWIFGPQLVGQIMCPRCGKALELTFGVEDIRAAPTSSPSPYQGEGGKEVEALSLRVADYEVRFRLPNSLDLAIVAGCEDVAVTRKLLIERCLLAVHHNDEVSSADQVPVEVVDAVMQRMAQADPQADVQLALSCPLCGHQWQAALDIASFFWAEINAWASRILHEVHTLASAYGWRETDILAMSPWRRQVYLEMVSG